MVPNESVETKAIATYYLPTLMRKVDRKDFFARTLVVTDTTSHNVACSALYLFKFEPSKGCYTAKEVKPLMEFPLTSSFTKRKQYGYRTIDFRPS
jgi:hypothetical protein